jgi:hypothetical protein
MNIQFETTVSKILSETFLADSAAGSAILHTLLFPVHSLLLVVCGTLTYSNFVTDVCCRCYKCGINTGQKLQFILYISHPHIIILVCCKLICKA